MATTNDETSYFIRVRGRVLGPYDVAQLKTLRARGQFGRANEVSTDRQTWQSAAAIEHLFVGSKKTAVVPAEEFETAITVTRPAQGQSGGPPSRSTQPAWHYSVGSEQYGPVTLLELRGLAASGQLRPDDLIWKEGFADWMPLRDVAELGAVTRPGVAAPTASVASGTIALQACCFACGTLTDARAEVCPKCGVRQPQHFAATGKDRITAAVLAFFLGGFGVHHFYLGNTVQGVIYLLFFWTLIPYIISFIEFIIFLCMSDASFAKKYGKRS